MMRVTLICLSPSALFLAYVIWCSRRNPPSLRPIGQCRCGLNKTHDRSDMLLLCPVCDEPDPTLTVGSPAFSRPTL